MTFHREGSKRITATITILLLINAGRYYFFPYNNVLMITVALLSLVFLYLILQFFRVPDRDQSIGDRLIISPCDGKVVVVEKTIDNEYYKDQRIQVSIFMSPLNVHVNWYPISGNIKYLRYHSGKYLVAWHPKASTANERTSIVIEKEGKFSLMVKQIAGALARRIIYYPHEGDMVKQGAELGFIKFGSRVDLLLPPDTKINVQVGDKAVGGVTVIGSY